MEISFLGLYSQEGFQGGCNMVLTWPIATTKTNANYCWKINFPGLLRPTCLQHLCKLSTHVSNKSSSSNQPTPTPLGCSKNCSMMKPAKPQKTMTTMHTWKVHARQAPHNQHKEATNSIICICRVALPTVALFASSALGQ